MTKGDYIVTHENPDWDACCSAYLLQWENPDADVVFQPMRNYDEHVMREAWAVADMGGFHDPFLRRFDHHGLGLRSASMLVWNELMFHAHGQAYHDLKAFKPIIDAIDEWDVGPMEPARRQQFEHWGMHGQLDGWQLYERELYGRWPSDKGTYQKACEILNHQWAKLKNVYSGAVLWDQYIVWYDGWRVAALRGGNKSHTTGAHAAGYPVVFFHNISEDGHTVGVHGEGVNVTRVIREVMDIAHRDPLLVPVYHELLRWHLDERGFFCGVTSKGGKASMQEPLVPIEEIAAMFALTWKED